MAAHILLELATHVLWFYASAMNPIVWIDYRIDHNNKVFGLYEQAYAVVNGNSLRIFCRTFDTEMVWFVHELVYVSQNLLDVQTIFRTMEIHICTVFRRYELVHVFACSSIIEMF